MDRERAALALAEVFSRGPRPPKAPPTGRLLRQQAATQVEGRDLRTEEAPESPFEVPVELLSDA
jgi:hypothetical protein